MGSGDMLIMIVGEVTKSFVLISNEGATLDTISLIFPDHCSLLTVRDTVHFVAALLYFRVG